MPTSEQQPQAPDTTPQSEAVAQADGELQGRRFRTIAVRVDDDLHSQLQFLAQLSGSSISQEIRSAIQGRIDAAQDDPELIARAEAAQAEIEREAAARSAAISGFMGRGATAATTAPQAPPAKTAAARRTSSKANG